MPIFFQSYRSSSAGNCLALWTSTSSVVIDCGIQVQRDCRQILETHRHRAGHLDAVVVSHAHGDHVAYGSLRVLGRERIPVTGDARVLRQLRDWHEPQAWKEPPVVRPFPDGAPARTDGCPRAFDVGDFHVMAIEVPHAPRVPNFGFRITARDRGATRTIVICTDLHDYARVLPYFVDADFIFVEANHDLGLLRRHPNPNSRYHLNNVQTASLLHHAVRRSAAAPRAVMLGHLSEQRNRAAIAVGEVTRVFERQGTRMRFHLDAAPAHKASEVIEL